MSLQKKDFIELEFTGRVKNGDIFDSNIQEDISKSNLNIKPKPFVFSLGQKMFLDSVDEFLIGKDVGKGYEIELAPEKAFGVRNSKFIQVIPMKVFIENKLNPIPGAVFNFDGRIAKILSVSGGRVIVDFNNPLAGKTVVYKLNVSKKIEDFNEIVKSLIDFLFRRELKFSIQENKVILEIEKEMKQFVELFQEKFKEILGLELEVKDIDGLIPKEVKEELKQPTE